MRFHSLSVLVSLFLSAGAYAQSTAFTYQGELRNGGQAVAGLHDLRFTLFTAASGGVQVGSAQCVDNVSVVDGVFTTTMDFGQQFATPAARFLQVELRSDTGLTCATTTGFTVLSPRQALTATPLANHAKSAFALDAADGSPANAVFVDNDGRVGVGTTSPATSLHVQAPTGGATPGEGVRITGTSAGASNLAYLDFFNSAGVRTGYIGDGGGADNSIYVQSDSANVILYTQVGAALTAVPNGNVGIGTVTPTTRLDVRGGAMLVENLGDQADLLWLANERSWVFRQQGTGTTTALKLQNIGGGGNKNFLIQTDGFVGIGTLNPQAKLDVAGTARVQVLEITGADLAEKFPASEKLEPGTVVAIDRENEGKLCMSRGAYDPCVAGVVSGANNFSAGAVLGNLPGHEGAPAIALSGRVYVYCDATAGAIEPGDLLTTSDTAGHAMKVSDRDRANGAIIGKAMGRLDAGERGLVLVLVNLQ